MAALDYDGCVCMLRAAAELIRDNRDMLSELDSHGGDGDHGTTMVRAMSQLEKGITEAPARELKAMFHSVAWAIMGSDGGATGPLFGAFFMGIAGAAEGKENLDARGLADAFEHALASVQKYSKAQVGDKTMIDALTPAVSAARDAADADADTADVLRKAADAAKSGAESTKDLQARFGRAKNIGEGSIGFQDAGATSIWLLFKGFSEGANSHAG